MNLKPARPDRLGIAEHLALPVATYLPWNFGLDQNDAPDLFPPGALCAKIFGLGFSMVALVSHRLHLQPYISGQDTTVDFYHVHLVPRTSKTEWSPHFRRSRWDLLRSYDFAASVAWLKFSPHQLEFDVEEQMPGFVTGDNRTDGGPYDTDYWLAAYAKFGLKVGEAYRVEHVYPLPYVKVEGVSVAMSAEVWAPLDTEGSS